MVGQPRKIVICPDSFKGSLTARKAAEAIARGVTNVFPKVKPTRLPIADGGEGLLDVLVPALGCSVHTTEVSGPLPGQRVSASWALSPDGTVAFAEMAQAAGLVLVPEEERDPKLTTTFGVGEIIRAALDAGARSIVIGIGGSGTNDGGAGMAEAFGVKFLDAHGDVLPRGGGALSRLAKVDTSCIDSRVAGADFTVACDVSNPLIGPAGASRVYALQKGASFSDIALLEGGLSRFRDVLRAAMGIDVQELPGSGAAGGLGAGLVAFCGAKLRSGIDLVLDILHFESMVGDADLIITGEGKLDAQERFGKALNGIARRAGILRIPVVAVVGQLEGEKADYPALAEIVSLVDGSIGEEAAMSDAAQLLEKKTEELMGKLFVNNEEH